MFSKENINHSSKKAKTIINNNFSNIYNHNNYSEIVNQKYPKSIILNNTILNRSNIIKKREIILLSSDIIDKNSFNKESKFAVLTNLRLLIYSTKTNYLLDMKPNENFKLIEYIFENENKILLIKKKEKNKNEIKYINVKKYEFPNIETAIQWWELIVASRKIIEKKYNKYINANHSHNNSLFEEFNKFNKDYFYF